MINELKELLAKLVEFPSITPDDAGCQGYMIDYLEQLGFSCQQYNKGCVSNFFAVYGNCGPLLVFAGHTDVVPVGELAQWDNAPFSLKEIDGFLYGRGTADMKGSLACMLLMAKRFVHNYPHFNGQLGFLITSGEEGDDYDLGTPYVMEQLTRQGIHIDYCIVGEPSSTEITGDVIKIGRRGSLTGKIELYGKQGHVAYPHLAENPIHTVAPALLTLTQKKWDMGNEFFPPTSMQITCINAGGHAGNIIPGQLFMQLNFRYSTEQNYEQLQEHVELLFAQHDLNFRITWRLSGKPFLTSHGKLLTYTQEVIQQQMGIAPELSTSGGTSDGRFIAPYGVEVIELGPVNATIHQVNERVAFVDLVNLEEQYYQICKKLLLEN